MARQPRGRRAVRCPAGIYARGVETSEGWSSIADLPGAEIVERGIADLELGIESVESLLVSIGAPRLSRLGIRIRSPIASPEHRLYAPLEAAEGDGDHSRYNALVRRLVSFERDAECAS